MQKSIIRKIALWSVLTEPPALFLLSRVPIDVGFSPGTNPIVIWLSSATILLHYPALLIALHIAWNRPVSYVWWVLAFLNGYAEIIVAAMLIYRTVTIISMIGGQRWKRLTGGTIPR